MLRYWKPTGENETVINTKDSSIINSEEGLVDYQDWLWNACKTPFCQATAMQGQAEIYRNLGPTL